MEAPDDGRCGVAACVVVSAIVHAAVSCNRVTTDLPVPALAGSPTGIYWLGASGAVRLDGDETVEVTAVRGSYAVGRWGSKVVRWDLQGRSSGGFAGAVDALDVNAHGHLLGTWDNHTTTGATGVWPDADQFVPVNSGARFGFLTDEGDVYGTYLSDPWNTTPVVLTCGDRR